MKIRSFIAAFVILASTTCAFAQVNNPGLLLQGPIVAGNCISIVSRNRVIDSGFACANAIVGSVFGRSGNVVAVIGDYNFSQIGGIISAGQLPTFTGDVVNSFIGAMTIQPLAVTNSKIAALAVDNAKMAAGAAAANLGAAGGYLSGTYPNPTLSNTYDNVAAATAATIPAAINSITVWNYRTGFLGGGGVYKRVGSAPAHLLYLTSNAGSVFWELQSIDGNVYVKQAGAYGDDSHDDTTAILNAALFMKLKHVALFFEGGIYRNTGLEFDPFCGTVNGCAIDFADSYSVILRYIGGAGGKHVSFTGTVNQRSINFGRSGRPILTGSNLASSNLYINLYNSSYFRVFLGDSVHYGVYIFSSVSSEYDIVSSTNDGVWIYTNKPADGSVWIDGNSTANVFNLRVEGMINGVVGGSHSADLMTGTSEGNSGVGYYGGSPNRANNYSNFFMELNGTLPDFYLDTEYKATITDSQATSLMLNQAHETTVRNGDFTTLNIPTNTANVTLLNTEIGTYLKNGIGTNEIGIRVGGAFQYNSLGASTPLMGSSNGVTMAAGQTRYLTSVMDAAEGNVFLRLPMAGLLSSLYIRGIGSPGVGQTYTATLRKNLAATTITCVVPSGTSECTDSTHSVAYLANDTFDIQIVSSAGAAVSSFIWSAIYQTRP